jgi:hypothetical protein
VLIPQVVTSTGLLSKETISFEQSTSINKLTALTPADVTNSTMSGQPLQVYYGTQAANLSFPLGTSQNLVLETLTPLEDLKRDANYTATVSGISTRLECETLDLPNNTEVVRLPWRSISAPYFTVNITTPSCNLTHVLVGEGLSHGPRNIDMEAREQYQGWVSGCDCSTTDEPDLSPNDYEPPKEQNSADQRIVMTVSLVQWALFEFSSPVHWLADFTTIMCTPKYEIYSYDATLQRTETSVRMHAGERLPDTRKAIDELHGLHPFAMLKQMSYLVEFRDTANHSAADGSSFHVPNSDATFMHVPDPIFSVLSAKFEDGLQKMLDPTALLTHGPKLIEGVLTQAFKDYYMAPSPASETVLGTVATFEERYKVQLVTVVLMSVFLGLSSAFCTAIGFLRPSDSVPLDPTPIASQAILLAASQSLQHHLIASGLCEGPPQHTVVRAKANDGSFAIFVGGNPSTERDDVPCKSAWWRPTSSKKWFAGALLALPLATIAALEVVQQVSDRNDGIATLSATESNSKLLATYVPAALLVGMTVLFRKVQLTAALLAPLRHLTGEGVPAQSLTVSMMGKTPLHAIYLSLRHRSISVFLTSAAVLVGSLTTIVVAALYKIESVPTTQEITLNLADYFDFEDSSLELGDRHAGVTSSLTLFANLSSPAGTNNNLVFPELTPPSGLVDGTTLRGKIPALRPEVMCEPVEVQDLYLTEVLGNATRSSNGLEIQIQTQSKPHGPCVLVNGSTLSSSVSIVTTGVFDLPIDGQNTIIGNGGTGVYPGFIRDNSTKDVSRLDLCPIFSFVLGSATASWKNGTEPLNATLSQLRNAISIEHDLTYFHCTQRVQKLMVDTTFVMPGMKISTTNSPKVDESTAEYLTFATGNYSGTIAAISMDTFTLNLPDSYDHEERYIAPITKALIHNKYGSPLAELLGPNGPDKIQSSANGMFSTYLAQAINANLRRAGPPPEPSVDARAVTLPLTYPANATPPPRLRVKQDKAAKAALQGILGFMVCCAAGSYAITRTKDVLPRNPATIAGSMSLLAGSEIVSRRVVPVGSEWRSQKERRGMWEGWIVSLGWWVRPGRRRFGLDVGRGEGRR